MKDDYAKWMLDDPRVNFAISKQPARALGVDHVGIQVDTGGELAELSSRLKAAGAETFDEAATTCCYAQSDKSWVADPAGVRWETFYTFGEATTYGEDQAMAKLEATAAAGAACCGPAPAPEPKPQASACCGAPAAA
ncbi:glyoxalase/bleomycin resistance/dioxygenase family protein [Phenylobacterium sp. J367]|uniref:glyoxalase/bleomycin resistance/dioxygenase family protein n=1 Tax=Phenylobacterium sp. J367 TaxID=2898435 RepID=UPI002151C291|nr:glyoxalase/bleomycin resistance/dioxygenase family protein [Phenylobacterium sp. J367]MCR5878850.1 glyoxalase/bleomycin resistance/dioxygenase family protein [Phenylobacterium sp. J367]